MQNWIHRLLSPGSLGPCHCSELQGRLWAAWPPPGARSWRKESQVLGDRAWVLLRALGTTGWLGSQGRKKLQTRQEGASWGRKSTTMGAIEWQGCWFPASAWPGLGPRWETLQVTSSSWCLQFKLVCGSQMLLSGQKHHVFHK